MIVIVDDHYDICRGLEFVVRHAGFEARCFTDPCVALAYVTEHKAALMLVDLMMPQMGGLDVLRAVRSDPSTCQIPVLLMSSAASERHVAEARMLGVERIISKSVDWTKLPALIGSIVGNA